MPQVGEHTADLVHAAADGDAAAWRALVDQHLRLVWSIARAHRLSDCDAADVVQTVWMRLLENIDRVRDPEHVAGWLATTTRRECLRVIALRKRMAPVPNDDDVLAGAAAVAEAPGDAVLRADTVSTVRAALEQLPARWRQLMELLMADEPPAYDEIATRLGMPVGSIGPTRGRALERLRTILEPV